ncbi:MAG: MATE family efflux transporter [Clostridia bacterium]|nr:MATE family efflux transporter [Clostridia bacterium]
MSKRADLTQGSVIKILTDLTIPMIFGILGIVAFNLADTYFVGKLGTSEMAALTFTFPVVLVLNSITLGLGVGASAVISKAVGEKNHALIKRLSTDSLSLGILFAIIAMIFGYLTITPLFTALGANGEALQHIKSYMYVWYAGVPFIVIPMIGNSAIRALGDTKTPSYVMMISAGLNIIFDPIMIFGIGFIPGFGVKGAAIATVCSRSLTFLVAFYILAFREHVIDLKLVSIKTILKSWGQILFIGLPTAFSKIILPIGLGIITKLIASYGQDVIAGYGIATRIEYFALTLINALTAVIPVYIGQNFGAKKYERIYQGIHVSEYFSIASGIFIYGMLFFSAPFLAKLFSEQKTVQEMVVLYLRIVPLGYTVQGIHMVINGSLNALHQPLKAAIMNIIQMFVIYVPLSVLLSPKLGIKSIFYILIISYGCTALLGHWFIKAKIKVLKKLQLESIS